MTTKKNIHLHIALFPLILASTFSYAANPEKKNELDTIYVTAEQQLQQSLGVSKITQEDIAKRPAVNDISELVRTMPGVNLTGNTASGQHGNKRQIDIRGMGPENTLILIDGRPVTSRNSTRMSWRGERDTNGDSNWVPVEDIQSIEVIRGPAAARYGSGAAGGVVNIITKKVTNDFHGSVNYYTNQPKDSKEGATNRAGFNLSGPIIKDVLSYRLYGNINRTGPDSVSINDKIDSVAAGKEGLKNKDVGARLAWRLNPNQTLTLDTLFSRQGNIYNGDAQNDNPLPFSYSLIGKETRKIYRQGYALTHDGVWDWGDSKIVAQYDKTRNSHCPIGLAGGPEGQCLNTLGMGKLEYVDSTLTTKRLAADANIPFQFGVPHVVTLGAEFNHDSLDDADSLKQTNKSLANYNETRQGNTTQSNWSVYVEDNIALTNKTNLIPMLRFDHNTDSGGNVSPGLNVSHHLTENLTLKGGIARAYKAPNLYQSNNDYLLYTRGNGCPIDSSRLYNCYLKGNSDLKAETSINKEFGFEYQKNGYLASLAYFRNDYKNKIVAGDRLIGVTTDGYNLLEWTNAKKAVVEGFEGNLTLPLNRQLKWVNNLTYMIQSKNKDTGNPLSVIPKYTINSSLDWEITEKWDSLLTFTYFGKQKPREYAVNNFENEKGLLNQEIGSYGIWGISSGYKLAKNMDLRMGITNIFDKRIYRSATAGSAYTYNESGRAIYGTMKVFF